MSAEVWPEQIARAKERLRTAEDEMHDRYGEWRRSVVLLWPPMGHRQGDRRGAPSLSR